MKTALIEGDNVGRGTIRMQLSFNFRLFLLSMGADSQLTMYVCSLI